MQKRRLWAVMVVVLVVASVLAAPGSSAWAGDDEFPKIIPLPNGFRPEGIVIGRGTNLYAGSLENGAIYRANLKTGEGDILVPGQTGNTAVGLDYDRRSNFIFVSGGPLGTAKVYDARTGEFQAAYTFTVSATFVNDAIVTRQAAYFTDSMQPVLYKVPLGKNGQLPDPSAVTAVPLGGEFVFVPGAFNANGIEATENGKWLIVVHSARGELYRVDPKTGEAKLIDLGGGSVPNGDGLLLQGHTLYVVQNRLNQIAVIKLNDKLTRGEIETTITDPAFRVPTTIDNLGERLYVVNARFGTPPTPDTEYEVVQVREPDDD